MDCFVNCGNLLRDSLGRFHVCDLVSYLCVMCCPCGIPIYVAQVVYENTI